VATSQLGVYLNDLYAKNYFDTFKIDSNNELACDLKELKN